MGANLVVFLFAETNCLLLRVSNSGIKSTYRKQRLAARIYLQYFIPDSAGMKLADYMSFIICKIRASCNGTSSKSWNDFAYARMDLRRSMTDRKRSTLAESDFSNLLFCHLRQRRRRRSVEGNSIGHPNLLARPTDLLFHFLPQLTDGRMPVVFVNDQPTNSLLKRNISVQYRFSQTSAVSILRYFFRMMG